MIYWFIYLGLLVEILKENQFDDENKVVILLEPLTTPSTLTNVNLDDAGGDGANLS